MAKFISRTDVHAETIKEINQEIEILRSKTHDSQYLSATIALLNQIDASYFNPIIVEVKQMFDIMKYYIDKDKNQELINPEIPHLIENYLHELALLAPDNDFNNAHARKKNAAELPTEDILNFSLQEKMRRLKEIEAASAKVLTKISTDHDLENDSFAQSDFEPKVMDGLIKQNEKLSTREIIKATRFLMKKEVIKANNDKSHYKIKTKWFWILIPILVMGMIATIIVPILI